LGLLLFRSTVGDNWLLCWTGR